MIGIREPKVDLGWPERLRFRRMNHVPGIVGHPSDNKLSVDTTAVADDIQLFLADLKPQRLAPTVGAMTRVYKVQPPDRDHGRPVALGSDFPVRCSGRRLLPQAVLMALGEVRLRGAQGHDRDSLGASLVRRQSHNGTPLDDIRLPEAFETSEHAASGFGLKAQCHWSILHGHNSSNNMAR